MTLTAVMALICMAHSQIQLSRSAASQLSGTWYPASENSLRDSITFISDTSAADSIPVSSDYMKEVREHLARHTVLGSGYLSRIVQNQTRWYPYLLILNPEKKYLIILWFRHLYRGEWDLLPGQDPNELLLRWGNGEAYTCYFGEENRHTILYLGGDSGSRFEPFTRQRR